jgi:hypothetical protein
MGMGSTEGVCADPPGAPPAGSDGMGVRLWHGRRVLEGGWERDRDGRPSVGDDRLLEALQREHGAIEQEAGGRARGGDYKKLHVKGAVALPE